MRRRHVAYIALPAICAFLATTALSSTAAPPRASSQAKDQVGGCQVFPSDNYWNTSIAHLPKDPHSNKWMSHMSPRSDLHPDFGPSYGEQPVPYGIPITTVGAGHPKVHVTFHYARESDKLRYPLGSDTLIEGGNHADGDRHAIIVDTSNCKLYETYATYKRHGKWHAGSGAIWSLEGNHLRHQTWTSADAAGLPILPGLLRYREVEVLHHVNHAIRFTTNLSSRWHIWPARHDAGSRSSHDYPPMGARFRLKLNFPMHGYRKDTRAVLLAMKHYGLVLADNGSPWYFQGEASARWPSGLLDELKSIPARAFIAVDTSSMKIDPNSGAANQPN